MNVLANINILSEGVDIPEIDSVVFADRSKTNERSMTQAVGRAMRTLPSSYSVKKRQGKVIIPSISDNSGSGAYNSGFVARAIAGADMVQKAVTAQASIGAVNFQRVHQGQAPERQADSCFGYGLCITAFQGGIGGVFGGVKDYVDKPVARITRAHDRSSV